MTMQIGDQAPRFTLETDSNGVISSVALGEAGQNILLYFYPKDDTSGCTTEAQAFSTLADEFAAVNTMVIGVSKDSLASHAKFRNKYALTIALGSDSEGVVIQSFGAWIEKNMYGRKYMGIERSTFLIDRNGRFAAIWRKVKIAGHAEAALAAAAELA